MHDTQLHRGLGEYRLNGFRKAFQTIDASDSPRLPRKDVLHAAILKLSDLL